MKKPKNGANPPAKCTKQSVHGLQRHIEAPISLPTRVVADLPPLEPPLPVMGEEVETLMG